MLAEIIREMREERGRTKGFDDTQFRERVELLGPQISLETLRGCITTACVGVLGDNWDEKFGELQDFKGKYGHCLVPARWPENKNSACGLATNDFSLAVENSDANVRSDYSISVSFGIRLKLIGR